MIGRKGTLLDMQGSGLVRGLREAASPGTLAASTLLDHSWLVLENTVYQALAVQTRLKPYLDAISLRVGEPGTRVRWPSGAGAAATLIAMLLPEVAMPRSSIHAATLGRRPRFHGYLLCRE